MEQSNEQVLVDFLKNLSTKITEKKLSEEEIQKIAEFYISYKFSESTKEYNQKEWLKFTTMGWFVYNCLK